jgi:hypothetical protein
MARPKKVIDYETVEKLARIHCTQVEIANHLELSVDTLQRDKKFCGIYKKGVDEGRMSLRRMQFAAANKGNVTMQIWLGKQLLSQRDKTETEHAGEIKLTIERVDAEQNPG